jgi:RHS repeat-associated protein
MVVASWTVVTRSHPQPEIDLTSLKQGAEADADAGDKYTGLDRFGRVVDQRWIKTGNGTHTDRFGYGYDRDSNRTYRDNLVNTAFGELYSYDGLGQLASFDRGTLNGTKTGISGTPSRSQSWDYDALGNWDSITTGGSTQTRSANRQNEITSISGATTPAYDANGNLTGDEAGKQFVYDAWNRLVRVKDSGGATLETFAYDGLFRRVSSTVGSTTTDLYYSAAWQVLEEKVGSNTTNRYVWSPVYVDALVLRDRDADANAGNGLEERLWVQQDANFNVTALVDGTGTVVERYAYDPFGSVTVYSPTWGTRTGSLYAWDHYHQGLRWDATATLYDNFNRWYGPSLGRFTSLDPIRFDAGDPNLYRYVGNGPVNRVDSSGLQIGRPMTATGKPLRECEKEWDNIKGGGPPTRPAPPAPTPPKPSTSKVPDEMPDLRQLGRPNLTPEQQAKLDAETEAGNAALLFTATGLLGLGLLRVGWIAWSAPAFDPFVGTGSPAGFGRLIGWGTGAEAAAARTASITAQEIQAAGITRPVAEYWLNFYTNAVATGRGGATAAERVRLMERILELLGG